jgi:ribonuclease HI
LACADELQMNSRPEKCTTICTDSQAALNVIQAARTSPMVQQCQKGLNDISTKHTLGQNWVPGHAGVPGNEITDKVARDGYA